MGETGEQFCRRLMHRNLKWKDEHGAVPNIRTQRMSLTVNSGLRYDTLRAWS